MRETEAALDWQGPWIWSGDEVPERNAWVRFRRRFDYRGGPARLHITADSRYTLLVNGTRLGQGPARCWPAYYAFDTYDLAPELRTGENVIAVLVQHLGEGSMQYIPGPPGLLVRLELDSGPVVSDQRWVAAPSRALAGPAPRTSLQLHFEEQFDARNDDDWTEAEYDDSTWSSAVELRPAQDGAHLRLEPAGLPRLTSEPVLPRRVLGVEAVTSLPYRFSLSARPYLLPGDNQAGPLVCHAYLATRIWSPSAAEVTFVSPHRAPRALRLNGVELQDGRATLKGGWNDLLASIRGLLLVQELVVCLDGPAGLRFDSTGSNVSAGPAGSTGRTREGGAEWSFVGPFALGEAELATARRSLLESSLTLVPPLVPEATAECGESVWQNGGVSSLLREPFAQPVRPEHVYHVDAWVQGMTDRPLDVPVTVDSFDGVLSGAEWTVIHPPAGGGDVRLLLDYGREIVGYHRFEVTAAAGTILDVLDFEFIQPDGRFNFTEELNNSARYTCREGAQSFQSYQRRGLRYSYLTLRAMRGPVRLRRADVIVSTYPQRRSGSFASSDAKLDRIWQVGAETLRCCAEDTYTDCPAYEQVHWVGDARNEALVDWVVNGDRRLWYHCLEQAGRSLDRSPLVEAHVPSSWRTIIPSWSFLWTRSCLEYLRYTGDEDGARALFGFVERNLAGVLAHINDRGLFEIRAWNMFDWAPMDTPTDGVVAHNNFQAVQALRDAATLAGLLHKADAAAGWGEAADNLARAIDRHLWSDDRGAYVDCLRGDRPSAVFSQQTQTAACMSGVPSGERAVRCRTAMHAPPDGFVRAGSPFFEFFLLEAYRQEGRTQDVLDTIRRDWGFMIDMGATTFWEDWSGRHGRLSRSHCHGWSSAPTFFLSEYVLGVRPGGNGYDPAIVEPHPGDLTWCRGAVPVPGGAVEVQWENEPERPFALRLRAPAALTLEVRLPREGTATVNGEAVVVIYPADPLPPS